MAILTDADRRLRLWLEPVVGDIPVLDTPPADGEVEGPAITAFLLGLESTATLTTSAQQRTSLVLRLRYLLCAMAPEAQRELELLDTVLSAALDVTSLDGLRFEVDLEPLPAELWLAIGARLRPSVVLRIDARHVRTSAEAPVVREQLRLIGGTVRSMTGRLLGPGDVPLVGAEVTIGATGAADRTSSSGSFAFSAVPAVGEVGIVVRVKGRSFTASVEPDDSGPVIVRCDPMEG